MLISVSGRTVAIAYSVFSGKENASLCLLQSLRSSESRLQIFGVTIIARHRNKIAGALVGRLSSNSTVKRGNALYQCKSLSKHLLPRFAWREGPVDTDLGQNVL